MQNLLTHWIATNISCKWLIKRPTQTRVRVMKIKNYVFWLWRRATCSKFPGLSQSLLPWRLTRKDHAISTRFIPLSRRCLCLLLLTSFLGRSTDVPRALQQIGRCVPPHRGGECNLAREKDPEAKMNGTTTRRNSCSSSNTVIYFRVCLNLL